MGSMNCQRTVVGKPAWGLELPGQRLKGEILDPSLEVLTQKTQSKAQESEVELLLRSSRPQPVRRRVLRGAVWEWDVPPL